MKNWLAFRASAKDIGVTRLRQMIRESCGKAGIKRYAVKKQVVTPRSKDNIGTVIMKHTMIYNFSKWMMVLSLAIMILGTVLAVRTHFFLLRAVAVTGTITELIEQKEDSREIYYKPVFLFKDTKGETHKALSPTLSFCSGEVNTGQVNIGDKYELLYDRENPSNMREDMFSSIWGREIILTGFGLLSFLFFSTIMLATKKMPNSTNKEFISPRHIMAILTNAKSWSLLAKHIMAILTNAKSWNLLAKWMMLLPCFFIIIGAAFAVRTIIFLQDAVPATGIVSELIEEKSPDSGTNYYFSVFAFQDAKGITHKKRSSLGNITPPKVGDKIEILYNPKNPDRAEENDYYCRWGLPMGCFRQGAVGLFILWLVVIISKRRMASAAKTRQQ